MRLRYQQLFNIDFTSAYYVDGEQHDEISVEPTRSCVKQMERFKIRPKKTARGIMLFYQCSPFTNDVTPFRPIANEEKFTFKVTVNNPDFWYYADIINWEKEKIYFLKNPFYNVTGNITVFNGALNTPVLYRPMEFSHAVVLDNVPGLLEIRDSAANLIQTIIVRARTAAEPPGKNENYFINLKNYTDGLFTIRHISSGGNTDTPVYCSADYSTGTLAIVEINYKTGLAWTGIDPIQNYVIKISNRVTDWFFDIHIRKKSMPVALASELTIKHINTPPEPLRTFAVVGVPDDINGFVQFKSNIQLGYSQRPMRLQLIKNPLNKILLDPLPLPSSITVQKDALNNLFTKIIVNV